MRKKLSVTLDEELVLKLQNEADKKNMILSRLIENTLIGLK